MTQLFALFVLFSLTLAAETPLHRWGRRALAASACLASAVDGYDSAARIDGRAITEGNPLLRNSAGQVRMGRMISLKVGMCAAPIVLGEFRWKREGWALSGAMLGESVGVDIHNRTFRPKP